MIRYFGLAATALTLAFGLVACDMGTGTPPSATTASTPAAGTVSSTNLTGYQPSKTGGGGGGGSGGGGGGGGGGGY
jgi:hypothetical protein